MMAHARFAVATLALVVAATVWGQEVFAPFPSRIRVATRDPQVRLSWDDATDLSARYLIYRHTEEITLATLSEATLVGVVEQGVESFIDTPPETGAYYYAILAQDEDETTYEVIVPFRNAIVSPVMVESAPEEAVRTARATAIRARPTETTIRVEFSVSQPDRTLALYRSVNPIRTTDDLARATRVATIPSTQSQYTDYVVPGVPYHYAVVDTELIQEGRVDFVAGENTTEDPVEIALSDQPEPSVDAPGIALGPGPRSRPLPFFQIQGAVERGSTVFGRGGPRIPEPQQLDPETDKAVVQLIRMAQRDAPAPPTLEVLPFDTATPTDADGAKGLDLTLRTIVEGPMRQGNWDEAELMLSNFLRLPLGDELTARANFYLGQVYYFQEQYRQSALAFLIAQEDYYREATRWLDRALRVFPAE
jgi:hypothetical protein